MILPHEQKMQIIEGLLPLLIECDENTERVRKVEGRHLIYQGITKDVNGKQIVPGKQYVFSETVRIKVNHKNRLKDVIKNAKTIEGMQDDLARYLVKFGKSKDAITESLPQHLRTKQL
jgi:hypothetical protein